ncbi:MAG: AMP-binding protein [Desulfobulbaceae bacterium]|nr:AMP-binding protein [Desulfobulbaceae bacterium]
MLIHDFLSISATADADKIAVVHGKNRIPYGVLNHYADKVARRLFEEELAAGDRVVLLSDDPVQYIAAYFGILRAGGIVVALNTQTSERSLDTFLSDCQPFAVLVSGRCRKYVSYMESHSCVRQLLDIAPILSNSVPVAAQDSEYRQREPKDIAQIIYTSGTTGHPKGVMLSHSSLAANTRSVIDYMHLTGSDTVMAVLPFFYSYGNSVLLTHIAVGGTLVVNQSFLYPNVILEQMAAEKVTGLSGVPSTFAILLHRTAAKDYSFPHLRYLTQAGAAMSPRLAAELCQVFPQTDIYIMYGQTEAGPRLSYLAPEDLFSRPGSIGKAIPGVTLELIRKDGTPAAPGEIGEIVASGENIMAGYWQRPEETRAVLRNGRLWTGDLAYCDDEGFLYIVSRKTDMIKCGAHRIAPKEIEEILLEIEAVHEAAVSGIEDEILGELIQAYVVAKPGSSLTEKDVLGYCRRNLPAFKVPHKLKILDELPKTSSGKIKKSELKTMTRIQSKRFLCNRCILPSTFPGISFDRNGVCNHCRQYKGKEATAAQREKYEGKFRWLLADYTRKGRYDVIVAYSGGKDSTYTLDQFVHRYGLNVLALTFDNTFVSAQASENIATVCTRLGVDSMFVRPDRTMLRNIFRSAAQQELYSAKTLERASTICTSCIGLVKGIVLRTAIEKKIPFVGFGWSPGQAPIQSSVMRTNPVLMRNTQQALIKPLYEIAGDKILPYFLSEEQFEDSRLFPWNIHPLAFLEYDEEKIYARIAELGWQRPDDTDPNSSNCTLNAYANHIHRIRYDFHPYVWEIANMVRTGILSREEGMKKIEPPENPDMVKYAENRLQAKTEG